MKENQIRVLRIAPFTAPEICMLDNHLRALQEVVSIGADYVGLIEVIDLEEDSRACILCNEEGRLIGLPLNRWIGYDIISGVFYAVGQDRNGNFTSLSEEQMTYYQERFAYAEYFIPDESGQMIVLRIS